MTFPSNTGRAAAGAVAIVCACAIAATLLTATATATAAATGSAAAPTAPRAAGRVSAAATSLEAGYGFLDQMMDSYATGSQLRLVQSYEGGVLEEQHFTDSITYDDAVVIDALLARGNADDVTRAEVIGNSLLYVQANDPSHDGRIRAAYAPAPLRSPASIQATDATSDVGNMAWVGQALVQLYSHTGGTTYLEGATAIGEWIQANAYDTRGSGGYTGGQNADSSRILWKSTEHNIDAMSLFSLLAAATHNAAWTARAAWARGLVTSLWNARKRFFYVGTSEDGASVNAGTFPEDVNSWSYLALRDPAYAPSIDWDVKHLRVNRGGFSGVSFCKGDRSGVWFEGTSNLADALELRGSGGDPQQAAAYLTDVAHAQSSGLNADGMGIIASSKNGLRDCEGERYFASLHTGATAWYELALQSADPFLSLK